MACLLTRKPVNSISLASQNAQIQIMKHILLSFLLAMFSFGSFASNKICIGEKVIVILNENIKRLTVHDKETMEIMQVTDLEGDSFGEVALSTDGTKLWFQIDDKMFCRVIETGEIIKEIPKGDQGKFDLSAAMDHLIHYETIENKSLIYVYDLNSTEAVSYAKIDSKLGLESAHYDHEKQLLHVLSHVYPSKNETPSKEPMIGLPESIEQLELEFLHDKEEMHYIVYDIQNKKALYDDWIAYSPNHSCNFEVINDELYIVTDMGTAKVLEDFSFELTTIVCVNLTDYDVGESELIGANGYFMFVNSFKNGSFRKLDSFEANQILIEADGIAVTETEYYCIKDGVFYRFKRSTPRDVDFEIALD